MSPLVATSLLQVTVVQLLPVPLTPSGRSFKTELAQGSSGTSVIQFELSAFVFFERVKLVFSLIDAKYHLREVEQYLHFIKLEETAPVSIVGLQTLKIRTFKAKKKSFKNLAVVKDTVCKKSRKRQKRGNVFTGLELQFVAAVSRILKSVFVFRPRRTSEHCSFNICRKR